MAWNTTMPRLASRAHKATCYLKMRSRWASSKHSGWIWTFSKPSPNTNHQSFIEIGDNAVQLLSGCWPASWKPLMVMNVLVTVVTDVLPSLEKRLLRASSGTIKGHCSKLSRAIGARIGDPNDKRFAFLSPCWQCRINIWACSSAPIKQATHWLNPVKESRPTCTANQQNQSSYGNKWEKFVAFSWCSNISSSAQSFYTAKCTELVPMQRNAKCTVRRIGLSRQSWSSNLRVTSCNLVNLTTHQMEISVSHIVIGAEPLKNLATSVISLIIYQESPRI